MTFTTNNGRGLSELFFAFLKLGLFSFGGPVAHVGYFREEFVHRRRWLDDKAYGDLVALCQFLPGPTSSQLVFALGLRRAGLPGGIVASLCFTLPSAVLMILFGVGIASMGPLHRAGWLHGLKLAAVAIVAQAVWGMGRSLCPDRARITVALAAAVFLLLLPNAAAQIAIIAVGGAIGWLLYRHESMHCEMAAMPNRRQHILAAISLAAFFVLLLALPIAASLTHSRSIAIFDSFYRTGSLVFGGGHVVLPLLRAEVVPNGWVTDEAFLAGYGAAQALPGPLFTFAAYLGTVMHPGQDTWLTGLGCLAAIFLPGWLLIGGALPFWNRIQSRMWAQAALRGTNAAVVGVLLAALYNPVWQEGVCGARDMAAVLAVFGLLQWWKVSPWLVVLLSAAVGEWVRG